MSLQDSAKGLIESGRFSTDSIITYGFYISVGFVVIFLWIPLLGIIFLSFGVNATTIFPFEGFTINNYIDVFNNEQLLSALGVSLEVATVSASLATIIGVLASFGLIRIKFRFSEMYRIVGILPLIIPGVIFGIGLLIFFRSILHVSTGFLTLILTHSVYGLPFVLLPVIAQLQSYDETLEESARDLGANTFEAFYDVTLPIIAPGIGAGFLFAWVRSFEDFIRAFFVSGTLNTLPIQMFSMIKFGASNQLNALSVLIITAIVVAILLAMNFGNLRDYI